LVDPRHAAPTASFHAVAADDKDDPGVLGNLPRSRPGRRSEKRSTGAKPRKQPAAGSTKARAAATSQRAKRSTGGKAAARTTGGASRTTASRSRPQQQRQQRPAAAQQSSGSSDPLTQAVRLAGKVAETGVKTAVGIIRRLPGAR
jgi:hypothetical protein